MNARSLFLSTIGCVAAAVLAMASGPDGSGAAAQAPQAPRVVHVCVPVERQVTPYEDFTGRIDAAASVEIKPRVTGYLESVLFKDGAEVKRGDYLFEIDPRPYQAQLAKAEADLLAKEAGLRSSHVAFDRMSALSKTGAIGQEIVDKAVGERDIAMANVKVARAALDTARITLGFARVHAPIDGRIGRRLLDAGNLVKADETTLATIVSSDAMLVQFDIDERTFLRISQAAKAAKMKAFATAVGLSDEVGFPRQAKVDFVDNHVDPAKGTIRLRAVLVDADKQLRPGMSCRVRLTTGEPHDALLVPNQAIRHSLQGNSVFIVSDKNRLEVRPVELGRNQDDGMCIVKKGLKAGERIALDEGLTSKTPVGSVERVDAAWQPAPAAPNKKP